MYKLANKSLGPRVQNCWIHAWCSNDSGAIFTKKILGLTLIVSYIELFIFILIFFCASSEWYSNNQNYEVKQGEQGKSQKVKKTKTLLYAIFPYKNNNDIFYDYSEINLPVRKTWLNFFKNVFFTQRPIHTFTQEYHRIPKNTPILPNNTLMIRGPVNIPERPRNR